MMIPKKYTVPQGLILYLFFQLSSTCLCAHIYMDGSNCGKVRIHNACTVLLLATCFNEQISFYVTYMLVSIN
jgi:hypothetical protein